MIRRPETTPPLNVKTFILTCCCTLLALAALVAAPVSARAADAIDTWDGTADTSWYDANPNAETFTLDSAEDLAGLAQLVDQGNTFAGATIYLDADVDLSGYEWESIGKYAGTPSRDFSGVFDGQQHSISGMTQTNAYAESGLFASVRSTTPEGAAIKNVQLNNIAIDISPASGAALGFNYGGLVTYATNRVGSANIGMVSISNCSVSGSFINSDPADDTINRTIGGILAFGNFDVEVIGCSSDIDFSHQPVSSECAPLIGGIVGGWGNTSPGTRVTDCSFTGSIQSATPGTFASGIVGLGGQYPLGNHVVNCANCLSKPDSVALTDDSLFAPIAIAFTEADGSASISSCLWSENYGAGIYLADNDGNVFAPANQTDFGTPVTDFSNPELVANLNEYASQGISWTMGVNGHPVLWYQADQIPSDYAAVDAALATVPSDLSPYTAASAQAVNEAVAAVDRTLTSDRQDEVDAMAQAIKSAVAALEKLADCSALNAAIEKAGAIDRTLYTDGSLAALDQALEAARAGSTAGWGASRQSDIDALTAALDEALAALERKPETPQKPVDENKSTAKDKLPGTGDPALAALVSTTVAGAGTLCLGMRLRKRQ